MAVYTDIGEDELAAFLADYALGELMSYKGIAEGVENSNFLLHLADGSYILTLYEKRVARGDLPFFLGLMEHLAGKGLRCPLPIHRRDGSLLGELAGRPAAVISFLEGMWLRRPKVQHCRAVGGALAGMHNAGADFPLVRRNALTVGDWRPLWEMSRGSRRRGRAGPRRRHRRRNSPSWKAPGRRTCRPASSTPICSRTTSSSWATGCRG